MTDIHAAVTAALAKLGAQHLPPASAPSRPYSAPAPVARSAYATPTKGRVSPADRKLEGMYADVLFHTEPGPVTCLIHTVEWKASAVRAYVMRLDKRTREYVTLDRLDNVRDAE